MPIKAEISRSVSKDSSESSSSQSNSPLSSEQSKSKKSDSKHEHGNSDWDPKTIPRSDVLTENSANFGGGSAFKTQTTLNKPAAIFENRESMPNKAKSSDKMADIASCGSS